MVHHRRVLSRIIALVAIVLLLIVPVYGSNYHVSLVLSIVMWVGLAVSWTVFSGFTGYISLGHAGLFGIGAYVMAMLWPRVSLVGAVGLAAAAGFATAVIIGYPVLRVRGPYFIILTLGLGEIIKHLVLYYEVNSVGTVGRILLMAPALPEIYYVTFVLSTLTVIMASYLPKTRFGLGLLAIKEDEDAAQAVGINTALYKCLAFGISGMLASAIGAIMALRWTYIDPYVVFNPMISFQVTAMSFLGGFGTVAGALSGAVILSLLSEFLSYKSPYYYNILLGLVVILLISLLPEGLLE